MFLTHLMKLTKLLLTSDMQVSSKAWSSALSREGHETPVCQIFHAFELHPSASQPSTARGMGLRKRSFRGRKWLLRMFFVLALSSGKLPLCITLEKRVESCWHTETPLGASATFPPWSLAVEEPSGLPGA